MYLRAAIGNMRRPEYGAERIARERGRFTEQGYIAYRGEIPLEYLLDGWLPDTEG